MPLSSTIVPVKARTLPLTSAYTSASPGLESNMNGGCKVHGPAVLADQLGVGVPLGATSVGVNGLNQNPPPTTAAFGCAGGARTRLCPEVIRAFEGVRYIAENTRREEESVRVSKTSVRQRSHCDGYYKV